MSRPEKNLLRNDRRSAFKAWLHSLMGNKHLFSAIVRAGVMDVEDMRQWMLAFFQTIDEGDVDQLAADEERRSHLLRKPFFYYSITVSSHLALLSPPAFANTPLAPPPPSPSPATHQASPLALPLGRCLRWRLLRASPLAPLLW